MDDEGACLKCPDGVQCDVEANELSSLQVEAGFFRAVPNSKEVYSCTREEACLGGSGSGDDLCSDGHEGPLCDR